MPAARRADFRTVMPAEPAEKHRQGQVDDIFKGDFSFPTQPVLSRREGSHPPL